MQSLQTYLEDEYVQLEPLKASDFEALYQVASDPLIWEQHPNKNRYQLEPFKKYFEGALLSKGAFIVRDAKTKTLIGCTRFCDYDESTKTLFIGYTFLARTHWGTPCNRSMKRLMIKYAFGFVDKILFHIGAENLRSQKAISKLGIKKIGEEMVAYYGEADKLNFVYCLEKGEELE